MDILALPAPPCRVDVEFLLVLVADDDLSRLPQLLAEVIDALRDAHAWIDSVAGSLAFATFGTLPMPSASSPRQQRERAVVILRERLGARVRIVHGCTAGTVGELASSRSPYFHFGSGLQNFGEALRQLVWLGPGEVRELS